MEDENLSSPKDSAIASIESAKTELQEALDKLSEMPTLDPNAIRYSAHALKNYLTVSSMVLDLLSKALADNTDPNVGIYLEGLKHSTKLMTDTVQLLSHAAVAVKLELIWGKVDLPTMVQRACNCYSVKSKEKRIRIIFESSANSPFVWTDRVAIAVVLDNLLSNAIKFSNPGKLIHVAITEEPQHLVCSVKDEGPGLTKEDQERLFQKGARLSTVPTGAEMSTGYGLAISHDIIRQVGGNIWYEGEPGQGSRFSFRLPRYQQGQT